MECVCSKKFKNLLYILKKLPITAKEEIVNFRNPLNGKTALFLSGQCDLGIQIILYLYSHIISRRHTYTSFVKLSLGLLSHLCH